MEERTILDFALNLGAVRKYKLQKTGIPQIIADFIQATRLLGNQVDKKPCLPEAELNTLVERLLASGKEKEDQHVVTELTPDTLLTSDHMAEKVTPWVEVVRTELFGSREVPFKSFAAAEQWLRAQEKQEPELNERPVLRWMAQGAGLQAQGYPVSSSREYRRLNYMGKDGKWHYVRIGCKAPQDWTVPQMRENYRGFSKLNWLENETRIMARATGFTQSSLVQYALTGTRPILPRFRATARVMTYHTLPSGELLRPVQIDLQILARDLTFEELRDIYMSYRKMLQLEKHRLREGKELAKTHREIYQLVKDKGGPPQGKGRVAFWKSAQGEWNSRHPSDKYETWKGIKLAWDRIMKRLEGRISGQEASNERPRSQKG